MQNQYCIYCNSKDVNEYDKYYHDNVYGFPVVDDNQLFKRLILEINQAGLSWLTILKKEKSFDEAFYNFDLQKVANIDEDYRLKLLNNPNIIRNRLKIDATIYNAKRIIEIQKEYKSFKNWLDINKDSSITDWVRLFKKNFKFTGGEIVKEFLLSTGYLPNSHDILCPIYKKIN